MHKYHEKKEQDESGRGSIARGEKEAREIGSQIIIGGFEQYIKDFGIYSRHWKGIDRGRCG